MNEKQALKRKNRVSIDFNSIYMVQLNEILELSPETTRRQPAEQTYNSRAFCPFR